MNFFQKFFGSKNKILNEPSEQNNPSMLSHQKIKRTIFDFFQLDLQNIPDGSFIAAEIETNTSGEKVENFRKTLGYKECGIFDTVEIKIIGNQKNTNVFFKSFEPELVNMDCLKMLIDELYLIYGNDSGDKGKFSKNDIEDFRSKDFYMLFGRSWYDYPKYKFPVSIDRDEDEISISIYGVSKNE